jgi:hypothetical protein
MALRNPLTWLPLVPLGAFAAGVLSPAIGLGGAALALAGVAGFWRGQSKKMEGQIVEQIIHDSNMAQDSALISLIRKLARNGYQSYAVTLGGFASLKTKIERALYQDEGHSPHKVRVGKLVDDLVFNVVDQLEEMAKIEFRRGGKGRATPPPRRAEELTEAWEAMAQRVKVAHNTLTETWHNLDVLLDPVPTGEVTGAKLDDIIVQLREENQIAEEVRNRVLADAKAGRGLEPIERRVEAEIAESFAMPERDSH